MTMRFRTGMSVAQKLMLISVSLLVPLGLLLWFTVSGPSDAIALADRERAGLACARPLMHLIDELGRDEAALRNAGPAITAALDELKAAQAEHGLGLGPDAGELGNDWAALQRNVSAADDRPDRESPQDALRAKVHQALRRLGDESYLVLDPEQTSYDLMDIVIMGVPGLVERLTRLRARYEPLAARGGHVLNRAEAVGLAMPFGELIDQDLPRVHASTESAIRSSSKETAPFQELAANLETLDQEAQALATRLKALLTEPVGALPMFARVDGPPAAVGTDSLNASFARVRAAALAHWDQAALALDELLEARANSYWWLRFWVVLLTALAIGGSLVLIALVARSITAPLQRCVEGLEALARRDLSQTLVLHASGEPGALAASLNRAVENLRSLIGKIQQTSVSVMASVTEFAANSRQQQRLADDYRQATNETAVAVTEISSTGQELLHTMHDVHELVSHSAILADEGRHALGGMEATIHEVARLTESLGGQLTSMRQRAENIDLMVTTIIKVADETNLLSINAAIEAEKAGDHGRGFSVVAREIRRLADQTAIATLDIEKTVAAMHQGLADSASQMERVQDGVERGVDAVHRLADQLGHIIESVHDLDPRFQHVHNGMTAQSDGAEQIRHAMQRLSGHAYDAMMSLQDFNRATERLRESIHDLNHDVAQFQLPGITPAQPSAPPAAGPSADWHDGPPDTAFDTAPPIDLLSPQPAVPGPLPDELE